MAEAIANGIESRNIDVKAVSFYDVKPEDLNDAGAIAIGSSTFYYKMLPPMEKFINETLATSDPKGKIAIEVPMPDPAGLSFTRPAFLAGLAAARPWRGRRPSSGRPTW